MESNKEVCPICGKAFVETDDVVVCPDCGTPHHRACWQQYGACAHAEEHAAGYVWQGKPVFTDRAEQNNADAGKAVCPRCGAACAPDTLVCPNCGNRFGTIPGGFDYNEEYFLRGVTEDPAADLGGMTVREAAMFVQHRAADYVRKFVRQTNNKKTGWNWAAFFFSPFWFFYRKAYKAGALFLGVLMVVGVFAAIPLHRVQNECMDVMSEYITIEEGSTVEQIASQIAALDAAPQAQVQAVLLRYAQGLLVYSAVLFAPNFFAALFSDYLYKKKLLRDVQSTRDFSGDERTFRMLALRRGGVSVLGVLACYLLLNSFFMLLSYNTF